MFTPPPLDWVEECRQAWLLKQEQASVATEKEDMPCETKRVCLFTEEDLKQPAVARKKAAPAEGVSFF